MTPFLRKLNLTIHVSSSVGWLGAVAVFLALAVTSLTSQDAQVVNGTCVAMSVAAWFVILPLAFSSLLTGVIQGAGTTWGLIRHYWVFAKLVMTVLATTVLLLKMKLISAVAAAGTTGFSGDFRQARVELLVHAGGGLLVLLAATVLSVFKPWGKTPFVREAARTVPSTTDRQAASGVSRGKKILAALIAVIILAFAMLHLFGGGAVLHGTGP